MEQLYTDVLLLWKAWNAVSNMIYFQFLLLTFLGIENWEWALNSAVTLLKSKEFRLLYDICRVLIASNVHAYKIHKYTIIVLWPVLAVALLKIQVFWDVVLCRWVYSSWQFRGLWCLENTRNQSPNYIASHPWRPESSHVLYKILWCSEFRKEQNNWCLECLISGRIATEVCKWLSGHRRRDDQNLAKSLPLFRTAYVFRQVDSYRKMLPTSMDSSITLVSWSVFVTNCEIILIQCFWF